MTNTEAIARLEYIKEHSDPEDEKLYDYVIQVLKKHSRKTSTAHPTLEEVQAYCFERGNKVDAEKWYDYYSSNGWKVGRNPMKDWKAAVRTWERNDYSNNRNTTQVKYDNPFSDPNL